MQRSIYLFFFLSPLLLLSQIKVNVFLEKEEPKELQFGDTLELVSYVKKATLNLISEGYFFTGLDSIIKSGDTTNIYIHKGSKLASDIQNLGGKNPIKGINSKLQTLANNGHPFSQLRLIDRSIESGSFEAILEEDRGPLIKNDSAYFIQPIKTNHSYIYRLLDHIPEEPFNESNYRGISKKIERVSFLTLNRPPDISFQNGGAKLYLDIKEDQANSFQGVVGIQQGATKTNFVGSFDLELNNLFRSGKELDLNWESFAEESQNLFLSYRHPFLLNSNIHPIFSFELLKQDTTFLRQSATLGFEIFLRDILRLALKYEKRRGTLLTTDENTLAASDLADYEVDNYKIEVSQNSLDQLTRLRSGYAWKLGVGLGNKSINKNLSLDDSFYDTLKLESDIYQVEFQIGAQFRLWERQTLFQKVEVGHLSNSELLNNERYRIGGLNSLRGFNEKFYFAESYLLTRTEFRTFFEKGSFLFLFYDQLFFRNGNFLDQPFGTGLGFSLSTLSGQFSFALGIGKSKSQSFAFNNMKVHFGYITRF